MEKKDIRLMLVKPCAPETRGFQECYLPLLDHLKRTYKSCIPAMAAGAAQTSMRSRCFGVPGGAVGSDFQPWDDFKDLPKSHPNYNYQWDYVIMVDTDMWVEPWMIDRMIECDVEIIGAAAVKQDLSSLAGGIEVPKKGFEKGHECPKCHGKGWFGQGRPVCDACNGKGRVWKQEDMTVKNLQPEDIIGKDHIQVLYCGFGLMVIKRDVFRKIPFPWFDHINVTMDIGYPDRNAGVDVSFCIRAREAGIPVWVDESVTTHIGHEKVVRLKMSDMLVKRKFDG